MEARHESRVRLIDEGHVSPGRRGFGLPAVMEREIVEGDCGGAELIGAQAGRLIWKWIFLEGDRDSFTLGKLFVIIYCK